MLYKTLKCASLVILFAAIGACDAGDVTGPDFEDEDPLNRTACVPEGSQRGADYCAGSDDEAREPVSFGPGDEEGSWPKPAL